MSYPSYTRPVSPSRYSPMNQYVNMVINAILMGGSAALLVALSTPTLVCWIIAGEIFVTVGVLAYCDWWLNDRLIGLPPDLTATDYDYSGYVTDLDQIAIGVIVSKEQGGSEPFPGNYDTDYTFNLLLAGDEAGSQITNHPFDYLIQKHTAIANLGLGFSATQASYNLPAVTIDAAGQMVWVPYAGQSVSSPVLHVEIEGAGVADVQKAGNIAFGLEVAALFLCLLLERLGPWGEVAAGLLAFLAFLFGLLGGLSYTDKASPDDITPPVGGELHTLEDHDAGADVVLVTGTWVYDTAHEGWNELHPLKTVQRIGRWTPPPPHMLAGGGTAGTATATTMTPTVVGRYVDFVKATMRDDTKRAQQDPHHHWQIHPYLDGCGDYPPVTLPATEYPQPS
jgi:hypothetical protein